MSPAVELVRDELVSRRDRLAALLGQGVEPGLFALLHQVDSALERLDAGTWGVCLVCHGTVEHDRLLADPLATVCLDCLSPGDRRALERDLETASRIQAAFLPQRLVRRDGWEVAFHYEPLGPVSGDHIDVVAPGGAGGPLHLLFGDVAGKGVAASLLQSHLRALLRALADLDLPLPELLARVNRLFCEATTPNAYATLAAARLAPEGGVEIANAGHLPPLKASAGEVVALAGRGLPVGLFSDASFESQRLVLSPGETLLLYTDGWTEAASPDGAEYGVERAVAALARAGELPLPQLLAACREDLASHLAGAPRSDDLSLMAVRRVV